jgi:Toprim domain
VAVTKSNLDIAREILAGAQADIRGTRGESYFTTDRGITLTPWPACLRFASKLTHPCEQSFPALVVEATDARTGQAPGSIQRIFLGWKKGKAQVDKPKVALGPVKGAVARLGEPIDGQPLLIAEGVENAATGMAASGMAAWATFGTAGLQGFNPPDTVKWVIALAENDEANAKALAVLAPSLAAPRHPARRRQAAERDQGRQRFRQRHIGPYAGGRARGGQGVDRKSAGVSRLGGIRDRLPNRLGRFG